MEPCNFTFSCNLHINLYGSIINNYKNLHVNLHGSIINLHVNLHVNFHVNLHASIIP